MVFNLVLGFSDLVDESGKKWVLFVISSDCVVTNLG